MSVVIVGGNERIERQYKDLCQQYRCNAKVYTKESGMSGKVGEPDLLVLFTGTMSHKMLQGALSAVKAVLPVCGLGAAGGRLCRLPQKEAQKGK